MDSAYAIEAVKLTKEFVPSNSFYFPSLNSCKKKKVTIAVNDINLQVRQGELFGLMGPNGAGKTTLIKLFCSLILPTRGAVRVAGYNILHEEGKVKEHIGLVSSDEQSFYGRLTGRQNLHFFASLYNLNPVQIKNKVKELLDVLEIEEPDRRFHEYSTGIKQRLSIARSLLNNPQVLFMDEPTKSLDPIVARELRDFIKDKLVYEKKITVFFTTHNLEEVTYLANRLAIMDKGLIKALGTIDELRKIIERPRATMEEIFTRFVDGQSKDVYI